MLTALDSSSVRYRITYAEKIFYQGQIEIAENMLKLMDEIPEDDPDYAFVAYLLGKVYENKRSKTCKKNILLFSAPIGY